MKISLRAARVNAGLTIESVAKELGVTPMTMYRWEIGRTNPGVSKAMSLSSLYEVPINMIDFSPKSKIRKEV